VFVEFVVERLKNSTTTLYGGLKFFYKSLNKSASFTLKTSQTLKTVANVTFLPDSIFVNVAN